MTRPKRRDILEHAAAAMVKAAAESRCRHTASIIDYKPGSGLVIERCRCGAMRSLDFRGMADERSEPRTSHWSMAPPAARIRALHAAESALTRRQLADRTGTTQQAVQSALRMRHDRPGRPRKAVAGHCETCRCAP